MRRLLPLSLTVLATTLLGCGDSSSGTGPEPTEAVATITVAPPSAEVDIGEALQLSAQARSSDGGLMNASMTWTAEGGSASVSGSGVVTGLAAGSATVRAAAGGRSGTAIITVVDPSPPDAPGEVSATPLSDTSIRVTWADRSTNETHFLIEMESASAGVTGVVDGPARVFSGVGQVGAGTTQFDIDILGPETAYHFRVTACNDHGCSSPSGGPEAEATTHPTIAIATSDLPVAVVNTAYSAQLAITPASASATWAVAPGTLPAGLGLSEAGLLSGTPTEAGEVAFEVSATGLGQSRTMDYTLNVTGALTITTASLPAGTTGSAYHATLEAVGGSGALTWSISAGALPPGLGLGASDGTIAGVPTQAGTYESTIRVQAESGQDATREYAIEISTATPASLEINGPIGLMDIGDVHELTATVRDSQGNAITGAPVEWTMSRLGVIAGSASGGSATIQAIWLGEVAIIATSETAFDLHLVRVVGPLSCTTLGGATLWGDDGQYLGRLTNQFDSESILNEFGSYGSPFSSTSIYNEFGTYGSPFSSLSAYNAIASSPPQLEVNGLRYWYVSKNSIKFPRVDPDALKTCTNFPASTHPDQINEPASGHPFEDMGER